MSIIRPVLLVGEYHVAVCIWDHAEIFDLQEPAVSFAVEHGPSILHRRSFQSIAYSQLELS